MTGFHDIILHETLASAQAGSIYFQFSIPAGWEVALRGHHVLTRNTTLGTEGRSPPKILDTVKLRKLRTNVKF